MKNIDLNEYNYDLPEEKIAQFPLKERDLSKLLIYKQGNISEDTFASLHNHIPSGSLLVFNNTKVIRARIFFEKDSGARIEVLCLEPFSPADYALSFSSKEMVEWKCIVGNLKKWKSGKIKTKFVKDNRNYELSATKLSPDGEAWNIRFEWSPGNLTFGEVIESAGHIPLPPYLNRPDEAEDMVRYQTIYSIVKGSVAAPTAGLHFTRKVLDNLDSRDIKTTELTLHVGAGTFQPVKSDNISEHHMHSEQFFIQQKTIEALLKDLNKIIPIGTTSVRTIESLYWLAVKLHKNPETSFENLWVDQWEPYNLKGHLTTSESLEVILDWMNRNRLTSIHAHTRIIIVPGYKFKLTNGMVTNFHLPKSTLLLLISAWTGNDWKKIYNYALKKDFRFLSYGDSSLLLR